MQEITLIGRIGSKDAAIYETANGNKFIAFSRPNNQIIDFAVVERPHDFIRLPFDFDVQFNGHIGCVI